MKQQGSAKDGIRALPAFPVVLVTTGRNIITVGMVQIFSFSPFIIGIGIHPKRHSHALLAESGEFVVNVPTRSLLASVRLCGLRSGRDCDKFAAADLTPVRGTVVETASIQECPVSIECRVVSRFQPGDHEWFVGQAVAVHVCEDYSPEQGLLYWWGGEYRTLGEAINQVTQEERAILRRQLAEDSRAALAQYDHGLPAEMVEVVCRQCEAPANGRSLTPMDVAFLVTGSDPAGRATTDQELIPEQWATIIDQLAELGTRRVVIVGRRPLAWPLLPAILERLALHGIRTLVETMVVEPNHVPAELLLGWAQLAITVPSCEPEEYDQLAGTADGLAQLPSRIDQLAGDLGHSNRLEIHLRLTPRSLPRAASQLESLAETGVRRFNVQVADPTGAYTAFDLDEALQIPLVSQRLEETANSLGITLRDQLPFAFVETQGCLLPQFSCTVESSGWVLGCLCTHATSENVVGNVSQAPLAVIWRSPEYQMLRHRARNHRCASCAAHLAYHADRQFSGPVCLKCSRRPDVVFVDI